MARGIKVTLPGYNAQTETNLDHFALYTDDESTVENILTKEFARGSVVLVSSGSRTITHNLGYIPAFMAVAYGNFIVNGNTQTGYITCSSGGSVSVPLFDAHADTTNVYLTNNSGNSVTFWYWILYDKQK